MDGGGSNQHHSPTHNTRTGLGITIVSRTLYTVLQLCVTQSGMFYILYRTGTGSAAVRGAPNGLRMVFKIHQAGHSPWSTKPI